MKKIINNVSRILFLLLLIVSLFGAFNVLAEGSIFKITKIEVKEKSDKVTVNNVSVSNGIITNDIVFTDENDYIIYSITIKNDTSDDYTIKSLTDNNASQYLEYTYDDLTDVEIASGASKTFDLKITYKEEIDNLTITNQPVNLSLTYEKKNAATGSTTIPLNNTNSINNGSLNNNTNNNTNQTNSGTTNTTTTTTINNTITTSNPKTGDSLTLYIILGIISIVGLTVTTVSKKRLAKSLMVIGLVSSIVIPLSVNATGDNFDISLVNNIRDAEFNVLYDANGGTYSDGSTIKQVPYRRAEASNDVYISHTENVDDTGKQLDLYGDYWGSENIVGTNRGDTSKNHVITIDGAIGLVVDVYYNGESCDGVCVWEGDEEDADCSYEYDTTIPGEYLSGDYTDTYTVNDNELTNMGHSQFILTGDTVTFGYYSDDSYNNDGYGYYAIVKPKEYTTPIIEIENPTKNNNDIVANGWCSEAPCNETKRVLPANIFSPTTVYTMWDKNAGRLDKTKFRNYISNLYIYNGNTDQTVIRPATDQEFNAVKSSLGKQNIVSTKYSPLPVYLWADDTTIYYYSSTGVTVLPEDSSGLFFYYGAIKTLDVSGFDSSEVKDMSMMFSEMFALENLDLSHFDTSSATNMQQMFFYSYNLKGLDLSNFNTSNVTSMHAMFDSLGIITSNNEYRLDLSSFDTSNVTDMKYMFNSMRGVTELDLSSFDTSINESFGSMFSNNSLVKIYVSDKFVLPDNMNTTNMFQYSSHLIGGAGTIYSSTHYDQTYAHIDGGTSNPGYFTSVADMPALP